MRTSIDACISECSLPTDRAPPVIETFEAHNRSARGDNRILLAPVSPHKASLDDLEFSDMGRDARFMNGRGLGLAIIVAAALCAVYIGFFSVLAALALAVVW